MVEPEKTTVMKSGKKNKKTRRNKKKSKKVTASIPLVLNRSLGVSEGAIDAVSGLVEYVMGATTAFDIKLNAVGVRGANGYSYDVSMMVPGYGESTGTVLCDLRDTVIKVQNCCPYTIYSRFQRPMGFKEDCGALAMWELLGNVMVHELRLGEHNTFRSKNNSTSHMVPREFAYKGKRYVHLFSFSAEHDVTSETGQAPLKQGEPSGEQIALHIEVTTKYKTTQGKPGEYEMYHVERFSGSDRLNHINRGPLATMTVADINTASGPVVAMVIGRGDKSQRLSALFVTEKGTPLTCDLDKQTVYRLPFTIRCMVGDATAQTVVSDGLAYEDASKQWCVCMVGLRREGAELKQVVTFCNGADSLTWTCFGSDKITPLSSWDRKSSFKFRGGPTKSNVFYISPHRVYRNLAGDDGILDFVLEAVVIIYEVSKVALDVLTVVGALADPAGPMKVRQVSTLG